METLCANLYILMTYLRCLSETKYFLFSDLNIAKLNQITLNFILQKAIVVVSNMS